MIVSLNTEKHKRVLRNVFKKFVFFSDEPHFHLSGYVKKQNMRYWVANNPLELYQTLLHSHSSPQNVVGCHHGIDMGKIGLFR